MFQSPEGEHGSSQFRLPSYRPDQLCHILLGDYSAVVGAINRMEVLGYCDRSLWIKPIATGRNGEYISVMSRKLGGSAS